MATVTDDKKEPKDEFGKMTDEEEGNLKTLFAQMGARAKADTKENLQRWMIDYVASLNLTPRIDDRVNSNPQPPSQPIFNVTTSRKPWLTKFSGDHGSEGYDLWQHQLISLIKEGHNDKDIFDAIRSSLHGKAGNIMVRLGTDVTDILEKMNSVFGDIDTEADVLATFYGARQGPEETVADWGCRLEGLFDVAKRQAQIPGNPQEAMRNMFWSGLRQELKDVSAYQFDSIKSFDELRIALRRIERQHAKLPSKVAKTAGCRSAQDKEKETEKEDKQEKSELAELKASIQQLTAEMNEMKKQQSEYQSYRRSPQFEGTPPAQKMNGIPRGRGRGQKQPGPRGYQHDPAGPVCFRCGERGHRKIGCRVRLDHLRQQDF